jgi:hypothetical protein
MDHMSINIITVTKEVITSMKIIIIMDIKTIKIDGILGIVSTK